MASECKPIPRPPRIPLLGNVTDIDMEFPLQSLTHFATKYGKNHLDGNVLRVAAWFADFAGPIYKLTLAGKKLVFVSSYDYVHETCDDTRFQKSIEGELEVSWIPTDAQDALLNVRSPGAKRCRPRRPFHSKQPS